MVSISSRKATHALRILATELGFGLADFDLRSSRVNGQTESVTLHADHLYVQVSMQENPHCKGGVLIRSCKSRKDYGGTNNNFVKYDELGFAFNLAKKCRKVMETKGEGIAFI